MEIDRSNRDGVERHSDWRCTKNKGIRGSHAVRRYMDLLGRSYIPHESSLTRNRVFLFFCLRTVSLMGSTHEIKWYVLGGPTFLS